MEASLRSSTTIVDGPVILSVLLLVRVRLFTEYSPAASVRAPRSMLMSAIGGSAGTSTSGSETSSSAGALEPKMRELTLVLAELPGPGVAFPNT